MPVTWSDEKLILLYCPGRGSNSRPSAHRAFKHGQGFPRPYSLGHGGGDLGVRLDWMLNFKQLLEEVAGKVTFRVSLIRRLAGSTWGASAKTLRISTQSLVFPAAEYCAPVWSRSPHVKKVDVAINSSLLTISGCLKPTPVFQLLALGGIAPAGPRRKAASLALAWKAVKHDWHILHHTTKNEVPPCRLKSRKPYNKEAQEMISVIPEDRSKDAWIAETWKQEWEASGPTRVHRHVSDPGEGDKEENLSRKHWTTLNRLRTAVGRYKASMKKWGLADGAACECGEPEQTADHIINSCPLHRYPSEPGLFEVGFNRLSGRYETMIYERRRTCQETP